MISPAVVELLAETKPELADKLRLAASWAVDWPNVKFDHFPHAQVPGENFWEEFAQEVANMYMNWPQAVHMPQLVVALDFENAHTRLPAFVSVVTPLVKVTDNNQLLPGMLVGIFETYRMLRRQAFDQAIAESVGTLLLSGRMSRSHTASWLESDLRGDKKFNGRLVNAVSSWVGSGPRTPVRKSDRPAPWLLIETLQPGIEDGWSYADPLTAVARQLSQVLYGRLGTVQMMDALKSVSG